MADATGPAQLLVAQPAAAQELLILGVPLMYFLIIIVLCFALMMLLVVFIWYWNKMGPVRAYFGASLSGSELGLLCRQSGRASFINIRYITGIFNAIDIPLSWIQRSDESYRLGACSMKVLADNTGIATEPTIQQAIKEFVVGHNDREKRRIMYFEQRGKEYNPCFIRDYDDLYNMVVTGVDPNGNEVDIPNEIKIHAVYEVPIQQVQQYLAHIGSGDLEGHIAVRIAEDQEDRKDDSKLPGWFWIAVAVEVVLMIGFIIANYFAGDKK
jgi:hypothetical protein